MFQRGPDRTPRLSAKLLLRAILHDEGPLLYQQCVRGARRSPKFALELLREIADRTEGKPTQHIVAEGRRVTIFTLAATPAPVDKEAAAVVEPGTVRRERRVGV